jgi:poly-gamma-glutamate synthesis protein (capsule biosynthesis protein)
MRLVVILAVLGIASPAAADDDADRIVLNVAGDVAWPDGWGGIGYIDEQKDQLFALIEPIVKTGDLNFANLECPFTEASSVLKKTYPITCHPKRLAYAVDAGFNLLSLANNHALDAGAQGVTDTHELLRETTSDARPVWWGGTGETKQQANENVIVSVPGKNHKLAFLALGNSGAGNKHVGSFNSPDLTERVAAAAKQADIVMVSVHYGPEYVHVPSKTTVDRYHALIDAGATLVVAHHAHVVQGVERYKQGIIFYNMGNFSFGSRTRRHLETGARLYSMIGRITLDKGVISRVELIPLYANNSKVWSLGDEALDPRHATPQLLTGAFAAEAMDEFEQFAADVPDAQPTTLVRIGDRMFVDLGDGGPPLEDQAALLHEQAHEYRGCESTGSVPRPATDAEKNWPNKAGTPLRRGHAPGS